MEIPKLLSILVSVFLFTACSVNDNLDGMSIESYDLTRSMDIGQLRYPLYSFIDTVDVDKNDIVKLNESLYLMQTIMDDGYNPLFKVLLKSHIYKLYKHAMVGQAQAAYNPYTNSVILRIGATITENVLPEELIHAGQNKG